MFRSHPCGAAPAIRVTRHSVSSRSNILQASERTERRINFVDAPGGDVFGPVDAHVLSLLERAAVPKRDFLFRRLSLPNTSHWFNTVAAVLTTLYVMGGGSGTYSYFFFAPLEVLSMLAIVCYAWKQLGKTA